MADTVFKRFELKYLLSPTQFLAAKEEIMKHMLPDVHGETTIQSLYYDTPDYRLARDSIEKPIFKEKLRLRCYGLNDSDKDVYLEMKRKYDGVVYKRRVALKEGGSVTVCSGQNPPCQIERELSYFLHFYGELSPKILILYDRSAFYQKESDLRVTFDCNIRYRTEELNLHTSLEGKPLISPDTVLMEVKTGTAFPFWLCRLLNQENIQKQSFSKYGTAYETEYRENKLLRSNDVCLNPSFRKEPLPQAIFSL